MKKILLLSLIFITLNISPNFTKADFIPWKSDATLDVVNYAVELNNIAASGSQNVLQIKISSAISLVKNLVMATNDACESVLCLVIYEWFKHILTIRVSSGSLMFLKVYSLIYNLTYCLTDKNAFENAQKIAQANIKAKHDTVDQKTKQIIWLTTNSLIPYVALSMKRILWNQSSFKNIFFYADHDDQVRNLDWDTALLEFSRSIINLSENYRRNMLYKQTIDIIQSK